MAENVHNLTEETAQNAYRILLELYAKHNGLTITKSEIKTKTKGEATTDGDNH